MVTTTTKCVSLDLHNFLINNTEFNYLCLQCWQLIMCSISLFGCLVGLSCCYFAHPNNSVIYSLMLPMLLVTLSPRISMLAFRFSIYFLLCICCGTACLQCNNDSLSPGACLRGEFSQITEIDVLFFHMSLTAAVN